MALLDPKTGLKKCGKCQTEKPPEAFAKCRSRKDGLNHQCRECVKQHYQDNREAKGAYNKQYQRDNREALLAHQKQHYQDNREAYKTRTKQYRRDNPEVWRAARHRRRALMVSQDDGTATTEALRELYATWTGRCPRCGEVADPTLDHITPLSKGGVHGMSNLQLMCGSCNRSKHASMEDT